MGPTVTLYCIDGVSLSRKTQKEMSRDICALGFVDVTGLRVLVGEWIMNQVTILNVPFLEAVSRIHLENHLPRSFCRLQISETNFEILIGTHGGNVLSTSWRQNLSNEEIEFREIEKIIQVGSTDVELHPISKSALDFHSNEIESF